MTDGPKGRQRGRTGHDGAFGPSVRTMWAEYELSDRHCGGATCHRILRQSSGLKSMTASAMHVPLAAMFRAISSLALDILA